MVEFEYLFLKDYNLGFCKGCMSCVKKGEQSCYNFGIVSEIRDRMLEADGVVLGSPVFNSQVSGLMKNFIDHFIYVVHRPPFYEKHALILVTTQYSGLEDTMSYLNETARKWAYNVVGKFGVQSSMYEHNKNYHSQKEPELKAVAKKFVYHLENQIIIQPTFNEIVYFRIWQKYMELSRDMKVLSKIDYEYWRDQGLLKRAYFSDIKTNPVKDYIARKIAKRAYDKMKRSMSLAAND